MQEEMYVFMQFRVLHDRYRVNQEKARQLTRSLSFLDKPDKISKVTHGEIHLESVRHKG